jgi:hypothetical protein
LVSDPYPAADDFCLSRGNARLSSENARLALNDPCVSPCGSHIASANWDSSLSDSRLFSRGIYQTDSPVFPEKGERYVSPDDSYRSADFFSRNRDFLPRFVDFRQGNGMRLLNSGFSTLSDEDFFDKGTFIVAQLTGNAFYPTTNPTLAALQTQLDTLDDALKMPPGQARDGEGPKGVSPHF